MERLAKTFKPSFIYHTTFQQAELRPLTLPLQRSGYCVILSRSLVTLAFPARLCALPGREERDISARCCTPQMFNKDSREGPHKLEQEFQLILMSYPLSTRYSPTTMKSWL